MEVIKMVEVNEFKTDEYFVTVNREEAMRIIKTLATQILNNQINGNRAEFSKRSGDDATYFTIGVREEPDTPVTTTIDQYNEWLDRFV
jgi:ribosomal protein L5